MNKLSHWIFRHSFLLAVVALMAVIGVFCLHLPELKIDFSIGQAQRAEREFYEQIRTTFGSDLFALVFVKSRNGDMFTKDSLLLLETLSSKIQQIEGVHSVESLMTVKHIQGGKGFVRVEDLVNPASLGAESVSQIKQKVFRNEMWLKYLISENGKTAAINVYTEGNEERILGEIDEIIAEHASENYEVYQIGMSGIQAAGHALFKRNLMLFVPASLLIACGILLLYYRNMVSFFLPLVTMSLSLLATFGFMAYMGYPVTPMTVAVVPLVMAFACAESGRMMLTYFDELQEGRNKADAILYAVRHDGFPLILTSITIALGLSVFTISEIPMIRQFGIVSAFGVLANCLITVFVVPGLGQYFPTLADRIGGTRQLFLFAQGGSIVHIYERYRVATLAVIVLLIICAVAGIFKLTPETSWHEMFTKGSLFRQKTSLVNADLAGISTLHILIETGRENRVKEPEVLRQIDALQGFIAEQPWCDISLSFADYIKIVQREMQGGQKVMEVVPGSRELVSQYLLLLGNVDLHRYVNHDYSLANIVVRHHLHDSQAISAALKTVRNYVNMNMSSDLTVRLTGYDVVRYEAFRAVLREQALYLALALGIIFVILSIIFLSVKVSLVAMFPPLISLLFHFGYMGWFNFPLNAGTCILAVLAFSLAASNLIHFLLRYQERLMATNDQNQAIGTTIYHEGEHASGVLARRAHRP